MKEQLVKVCSRCKLKVKVTQKICRCGYNVGSKHDQNSKRRLPKRSQGSREVQKPNYFDSREYEKKKPKKRKEKSAQELREERAQQRANKKEHVHLQLPPHRAKQILDDINRRLISSSWRPPDLPMPSTSYAHHDIIIDHSPLNEIKDDPDTDPLTLDAPMQPVDEPNSTFDSEKNTTDVTKNEENISNIEPTQQEKPPLTQSNAIQETQLPEIKDSEPVSHVDHHKKIIVNMPDPEENNFSKAPITLFNEEPAVAEIVKSAATL